MNDQFFINWTILKAGISQTAKLIWHVLKQGVVSPTGVRDALGLGKNRVHSALRELVEHGFVIRIGFGYYRVLDSAPEVSESAPKDLDSALLQGDSAQKRTPDVDLKSPLKRTQRAQKDTFPSVARTFLSNRLVP